MLSTTVSPFIRKPCMPGQASGRLCSMGRDRKSTRLNSSHVEISYAVFCLKKKKLPPAESPLPTPPRTPPASTNPSTPYHRVRIAPPPAPSQRPLSSFDRVALVLGRATQGL